MIKPTTHYALVPVIVRSTSQQPVPPKASLRSAFVHVSQAAAGDWSINDAENDTVLGIYECDIIKSECGAHWQLIQGRSKKDSRDAL